MRTYRTYSSTETKTLGAVIAEKIQAEAAKNKKPASKAKVIALHGDLGAGKTTFTQGFLKALGAKGRVTSPTFVLMKRFPLKTPAVKKAGFTHAYHIDAYRFKQPDESDALEIKEILRNPKALVVIEWPERLKDRLSARRINIRFRHGKKENERVIIAP